MNEALERALPQDSVPVVSGTLAELDTTLLENGLYTLTLRAEDVRGQSAEASHAVRVNGGAKVGVVRLAFVDSVIPMAGIPIQVVRRYDSRDKTVGEFGYGWRLDIAVGSPQHN